MVFSNHSIPLLINRFRDNVAHIVTHNVYAQTQHWKQFMTQQGR